MNGIDRGGAATAAVPALVREVTMRPAFDRRDPDPSKNYGIHGVELKMVLRGDAGAMQFIVYTNWQLPHVNAEMLRKPINDTLDVKCRFLPLPADIGYHSKVPMYEGQQPMDGDCPYTSGVCYYDGSSLMAEDVFEVLLREGSDGVWADLERRYNEQFGAEAAAQPQPHDDAVTTTGESTVDG
jgi:hypothetical protein